MLQVASKEQAVLHAVSKEMFAITKRILDLQVNPIADLPTVYSQVSQATQKAVKALVERNQ
jgi:hypothetical protein